MAFLKLIDDLRKRFAVRGFTEVEIVDGIESRNEQSNYGAGGANRIAFVPSSQPMPILPPTFIGEGDGLKRQLFNVMFIFDVSFAGFDADHPDRDLAHRRKCFDMFEVTAQELQLAYAGAHAWTDARWDDAKKHVRHGAELVATLTLNIPLFDVESAIGTPAPVPGEPKPVT